MATYNTFVVVDCKRRTPLLVTSSARKAGRLLSPGFRIEVWSNNTKTKIIYQKSRVELIPYIKLEKEYIGEKQAKATNRRTKSIGKYNPNQHQRAAKDK